MSDPSSGGTTQEVQPAWPLPPPDDTTTTKSPEAYTGGVPGHVVRSLTIITLAGSVLVLAIIIAVSVLTWHGSITGEAAIAIFGAIVGGGGVATVSHLATQTGADAVRGRFD